jgi:glucosamine-6-phosphate deaminase
MESDINRVLNHLATVKPDIITVALDPCGIGPKNHFITLQLIVAALQRSQHTNVQILGYRNIWSNFELQDASIIIPVTQAEIDQMKSIFSNCFATQKTTMFFGTDIDGNFADQAEQIQKNQLQQVQEVLGDNFEHNQKLIMQESVGAIFMKKLTIDELINIVNELY